MASFDPPWRLDPLKNIVNVGWGGNRIMTLAGAFTVRFHAVPAVTVNGLPFSSSGLDLFIPTLKEHDNFVPVPAVADPVTKEMIAHLYAWNRPVVTIDSEGSHGKYTIWFFNINLIRSKLLPPDATKFEFTVRTPASTNNNGGGVIYWVWQDSFYPTFEQTKDHPFTTGAIIDGAGHSGTVVVPMAFASEASRAEFLGWNTGSSPPWLSFNELSEGTQSDKMAWSLEAVLYLGRTTYVASSKNAVQDKFTKAASGASQSAAATDTVQIPSYTVTVSVNLKTNAVTMTKV